jgi:recombination protein RecR
MWPRILDKLTDDFASLPGVGPKLARKIAIHLVNKRNALAEILAQDITTAVTSIDECNKCGNIKETSSPFCEICSAKRNNKRLLVVENVLDLIAIEQGAEFDGYYFVLGGLLSPVKGFSVQNLKLDRMEAMIQERDTGEVILGLANTLEGEATSIYLKNHLQAQFTDIEVTQLAIGIPTGVNIEFLDKKTLKGAFAARS